MKTEKQNKFDLILKMFVGHDDLRAVMKKIHNDEGTLVATNAHILIRMPEKMAGIKYESVEKYPNYKAAVGGDHVGDKMKVNIDTLAGLLSTAESYFNPDHQDCDTCEGNGYTTCDYCQHDHDCDDCDASGKSQSNSPFAKLSYESRGDIVMNGFSLNPKYLWVIWQTALIAGVSEIIFTPKDNETFNKSLRFDIGEINGVIMPIARP